MTTSKSKEAEDSVVAEATKELEEALQNADGYELNPSEVAVHLEVGGARLTHIFSRLLNRGERINITAAAAQQEFRGDEIILDAGNSEEAYANAWTNMIGDVQGYVLGGKPAGLEAAREKIPAQHKRAALDATNQVRVKRGSELNEAFDLDSAGKSAVILEAKQGATTKEIGLLFSRPLNDSELRQLQKRGMRFKQGLDGGLIVGSKDSLRLVEEFFDNLLTAVLGYDFDGKPVNAEKDWLKKIPIDHKAMAVGELRRRATARLADPS